MRIRTTQQNINRSVSVWISNESVISLQRRLYTNFDSARERHYFEIHHTLYGMMSPACLLVSSLQKKPPPPLVGSGELQFAADRHGGGTRIIYVWLYLNDFKRKYAVGSTLQNT